MSDKPALFLALTVGALFACEPDVTSPVKVPTVPSLAATAGGVETNVRIPLTSYWAWVSCANQGAGEIVVLNGTLHILINVTVDNQGGFHLVQHFQPQNLSGVGLITGDKYRGTGATLTTSHSLVGGVWTYVNNYRMIGAGPGNNYLVHTTMHGTVNANGEVTAWHDNTSIECK